MLNFLTRYRSEWAAAGLLCAGTLVAMGRVVDNDFVNFDDYQYVTGNLNLGLSDDNIIGAFTTFRASNWHPLTWLSLGLDLDLYGHAAWGFHLTNLLLHAASAQLLFLFLRLATGAVWRSFGVAALFAMHPLHVESVAWISERKDVLSAFFWMLTLFAYLNWARRPLRLYRYAWIILAFALGLLAKPMLVTLPCVLLLLDFWPLERWRPTIASTAWLLLEKLPLFVLTGLSCALTSRTQGRAIATLTKTPLAERIGNALVAYVAYLGQMVWPIDLAAYYPHPGAGLPLWQPLAAGAVLAAITVVAIRVRSSSPYVLVGWLWYVGTLVPVIGLVQVGRQAMADRYTYLPLIGIFIAVVWLAVDVVPVRRRGLVLAPIAAVVLLLCAAGSWRQAGFWHDSITLWEHTLALTKNNFLAHFNLGNALENAGRLEEAFAEYEKATSARPDDPRIFKMVAESYQRHGRNQEALAAARRAVALDPRNYGFHYLLAEQLRRHGDVAEADAEDELGDRLYRKE